MSERETGKLTPAMLAGTPVGGPGGMAVCDTCNRRLTDGDREHDTDDTEADTVYAYATRVRDTNRGRSAGSAAKTVGRPATAKRTNPARWSQRRHSPTTLELVGSRSPTPNSHPTPRRSLSRTVSANEPNL
jgi:murein L,D-transpeptidase YcbB/YkuD